MLVSPFQMVFQMYQNIDSCTINPLKDNTGNRFEAQKGISGTRTLVMIKLNDRKDTKEGK